MPQTQLAEKLQRSGFIPREVRFTVAIARALNVGGITGLRHFLDGVEEFQLEHGTIERARELLAVAADKMGGGGQMGIAVKANSTVSPASQPPGDEGQSGGAEKATLGMPSSPPPDSAAGQSARADGHSDRARPLSPNREGSGQSASATGHRVPAAFPREPSALDRAAAVKAARTSAVAVLTIFDRYKVRDGRALKRLRYHELMKLAQEDEGEARAFRYMVAEVEAKVANPNRMALVPELVTTEIAERAFAFAKVAANAS
jgi:hypothetical protein